jgi:hypothetical protein
MVDKALSLARQLDAHDGTRHVFITGSQHLVGSALEVLEPDDARLDNP